MLSFYSMGIAGAFNEVRTKIRDSAVKAGRDFDNIKLVAVSKTVGIEKVIEAVNAGAYILGENRVQEAKAKITELRALRPDLRVEWHLIGNLQRNKAGSAVQLFDMIHSVDSEKLADEINSHARQKRKKQRVLVQVKLADEAAKHGISEKNLMELLQRVSTMENLKLEGLMLMPPFFEDPEKTRPYFKRLRLLAETASEKGFPVRELSMGMSHDFETAVEEGATMVRVGTLIFGERNR